MADKDEQAVLDELGVNDGGQGEAANAPAKSTVPNAKSRQQKAADTRKANKAAKEAAEKAAREEEDSQGVVQDTVVPGDMDGVPVDDAGNPLWYFNPKSRRVIPANDTLNRPDIRDRMRLRPCQPPLAEKQSEKA